jgi:prepilin-type N-terminal cleavage/methylation domain-containing protein
MTISKIGSRAAKGFTLIEVLMAISLLAVGMVGVLRAYSTSVNAMEIAQYNIDASCLLKAVMGNIEEKSIDSRGTPAGSSEESLGSSSDIKIDTTRAGRWQWEKEVLGTSLEVVKTVNEVSTTAASGASAGTAAVMAAWAGPAPDTGTDTEKKQEKIKVYSLNEVKITEVNPGRSPARKVSLVTYMESESAES